MRRPGLPSSPQSALLDGILAVTHLHTATEPAERGAEPSRRSCSGLGNAGPRLGPQSTRLCSSPPLREWPRPQLRGADPVQRQPHVHCVDGTQITFYPSVTEQAPRAWGSGHFAALWLNLEPRAIWVRIQPPDTVATSLCMTVCTGTFPRAGLPALGPPGCQSSTSLYWPSLP